MEVAAKTISLANRNITAPSVLYAGTQASSTGGICRREGWNVSA